MIIVSCFRLGRFKGLALEGIGQVLVCLHHPNSPSFCLSKELQTSSINLVSLASIIYVGFDVVLLDLSPFFSNTVIILKMTF